MFLSLRFKRFLVHFCGNVRCTLAHFADDSDRFRFERRRVRGWTEAIGDELARCGRGAAKWLRGLGGSSWASDLAAVRSCLPKGRKEARRLGGAAADRGASRGARAGRLFSSECRRVHTVTRCATMKPERSTQGTTLVVVLFSRAGSD